VSKNVSDATAQNRPTHRVIKFLFIFTNGCTTHLLSKYKVKVSGDRLRWP